VRRAISGIYARAEHRIPFGAAQVVARNPQSSVLTSVSGLLRRDSDKTMDRAGRGRLIGP